MSADMETHGCELLVLSDDEPPRVVRRIPVRPIDGDALQTLEAIGRYSGLDFEATCPRCGSRLLVPLDIDGKYDGDLPCCETRVRVCITVDPDAFRRAIARDDSTTP